MYRLRRTISCILVFALSLGLLSCAKPNRVVRDQLVVEKLRLRITKVRNAAQETRNVIAASKGAPYLAELYMRLAELMSEEARYHYMVAYEREQRRSKSLHVPQVRFLKEQAINTYTFILKRYPKTHLGDRILFNIAHEHRELGNFDDMVSNLERLVKEYPESPYRSEALLVLGDYRFDKTEFATAEKHYREILEQENGPLVGLANYKLAWVFVNLTNCTKALIHFEEAIKQTRALQTREEKGVIDNDKLHENRPFAIPKSHDAKYSFAGHKSVDVERESLVDLTYCYAQERKPENAVAYLTGLASSREAYIAALSKLATRYAILEQPLGAAAVARELLSLAPDNEERLDDARMLHNAISRMKDYSTVGDDVELILKVMRRQLLKPDIEANAAKLLQSEFEMIARDLSTKSHELIMNPTQSKKSGTWKEKPYDAAQTAKAYTAYLDALKRSPNRLEVLQNLADILAESGRYLLAGHRYREAAALLKLPPPPPPKPDPKAKPKKNAKPPLSPKQLEQKRKVDRRDALFNAVAAYQNSLESEKSRGHLERTTARAGLRDAGGQYLAEYIPERDKAIRIKFAIAQSYYDEGSYLDAINLLTGVAYEYPDTKQGEAAAHMVMDSLRTINDIGNLIDTGRRIVSPNSPFSQELKAQISPIVGAAEQRRLDELSLAASGDSAGGMETLLAFADRYKNSSLGERAMLSAFVAARAGGDVDKLYKLGEAVIQKYPGSEQVSGVVSTMGSTAAARFEFDRAIQYFEKSAQMDTDQKASLLLTAGKLREQLADRPGAIADYQRSLAAAGEGPQRSEAAVALADLIEKGGSPSEIVQTLTPLSTPPDPEISSRLGLALLKIGKQDEAEMQLRSVIEGGLGASTTAQARANYGLAEINLKMLENFTPPPDLSAIEEAVGLVDMVLQSYLAAARQPDPVFSQAALARLARAAEVGATKLEQIQLPSELGGEERTMIQQAMTARAEQLRHDMSEALAECANRAKTAYLLTDAGRSCIMGVAPKDDPVTFKPLSPRRKGSVKLEEARNRLAKNPEDLDAIRAVGKAFIKAGDAHAARLILGRSIEAGGGAEDINLLGIASYQAGDMMGALDAFGRAKDAGSGAATRNLAAVCSKLGLPGLAKEYLKDAPEKIEGALLPEAAGGR